MFISMAFKMVWNVIEVIAIIAVMIIADLYFQLGITDSIITMLIDYVKSQIVWW